MIPAHGSPADSSFRVIVLTCGEHGWETARALSAVDGIRVIAVVSAPMRTRTFRARLRTLYRRHGTLGAAWELLQVARHRLRRRRPEAPSAEATRPVGVQSLNFDDLHGSACLEAVRSLAPDLAVVDGTYILKPVLFGIPRHGSINLHCGKLPEYRGAPPVFWELMHGERQCGVSVHQVTAGLDEGAVYNQALLPLDPAPPGDPVAYAHRFWLDALRPAGLSLLAQTVQQLAAGTAVAVPQPQGEHQAHRMPDHHARRELRLRVAARRRAIVPELPRATSPSGARRLLGVRR